MVYCEFDNALVGLIKEIRNDSIAGFDSGELEQIIYVASTF